MARQRPIDQARRWWKLNVDAGRHVLSADDASSAVVARILRQEGLVMDVANKRVWILTTERPVPSGCIDRELLACGRSVFAALRACCGLRAGGDQAASGRAFPSRGVFRPSVDTGITDSAALRGWRTSSAGLRGWRYVPPNVKKNPRSDRRARGLCGSPGSLTGDLCDAGAP